MSDEVPEMSVLSVGVEHFRAHLSDAWREVGTGACLRIVNQSTGRHLAWVTLDAPPEWRGREHLLPDPREAADDLRARYGDQWPPSPPAEPSPWTVREAAPEPQQAGAA